MKQPSLSFVLHFLLSPLKERKMWSFLPKAVVDMEGLQSDDGRAEDPFHTTEEGWN
jgi:hypothetical protein